MRPSRVRGLMGVVAALLAMVGLYATGAGLSQLSDFLPGLRQVTPAGSVSGLAASQPTEIAIPAIEVRAPVRPVGLTSEGAIEAPPLERAGETGWYDRSPAPGQNGPAIIVGHVDTRDGPAVFHRLHTLRPGDVVEVARKDGRVAVFEVEGVDQFDKFSLPVDRVYGDVKRPVLRLITCGGDWVGGDTGYADNVIVFASLVDSRKA
ncbi:MAG: class F sortase [Micromonosporaceae bacterium]